MVQADGMPLAEAVAHCRKALCDTSAGGTPVVGMVLRYDLTIIDHLDRAHGNRGLQTPHWIGPVLDVSLIDRRLDKFRKGRRTLSDLCEVYNVVREKDSAHNAATDAVAAIEVMLELTRAFKILGKTDLATLHARQHTIYQEYLIDLNEHRLRQGLKPIAEYEISGGWPVATLPLTA
jgi:DNA polymerase-3 subunit epsilon